MDMVRQRAFCDESISLSQHWRWWTDTGVNMSRGLKNPCLLSVWALFWRSSWLLLTESRSGAHLVGVVLNFWRLGYVLTLLVGGDCGAKWGSRWVRERESLSLRRRVPDEFWFARQVCVNWDKATVYLAWFLVGGGKVAVIWAWKEFLCRFEWIGNENIILLEISWVWNCWNVNCGG